MTHRSQDQDFAQVTFKPAESKALIQFRWLQALGVSQGSL